MLVPEKLLAGIFNLSVVLYLICFIIASLGNIVLVYRLSQMLSNPTPWLHNKRFLYIEDVTIQPYRNTDKQLSVREIILYRRTLLFNYKFWTDGLFNCFPTGQKRNKMFKIILFLPWIGLAILAIALPLVDLLLHVTWLKNDNDNENDSARERTPHEGTPLIEQNDRSKTSKVVSRWDIICKLFLSYIYGVSFVYSHFWPGLQVISMISGYTITGLMKNWNVLLPALILMLVVATRMILIIYGAYQPMYELQQIVFDECVSIDKNLKKTNKILKKDAEGKYSVSESFIKDCYSLLAPAKYSYYTLFALLEFSVLLLLLFV